MADFNPDQYLAEKSQPTSPPQGFDPDTYLAQKTGGPGPAQAALEHGANAASYGYIPHLQALAEPVTDAIGNAYNRITGSGPSDVGSRPGEAPYNYVKSRDKNINRLNQEEEQNPKSALAGKVGGSVVSALATPLPVVGAGKGLLSLGAHGAAYGAAQGAVSNPGDTEGKLDPYQLSDRAVNTAKGTAIGGVAGVSSGLVGKGLNALAQSGESASKFAQEKAIKASGGMLRDFRSMGARGQIEPVGQFALDHGLVQAGDTVEDVANKSEQFNKKAGDQLKGIYDQAHSEALANAKPEDIEKINSVGFNPAKDKDAILDSIKQSMGKDVDKKSAINHVSNYLDTLIEEHGDRPFTPKEAQEVKTAMDQKINYSRNPLSSEPAAEKGFSAARKFISQKIDQDIDTIGHATGQNDLLEQLKGANADYGRSAQLKSMAHDRVARENANRSFGLTDTIAGSAGGIIGGAAGQALGGNDGKHIGEGALLGGLVAGGANKLGRTYGPAIQASMANKTAPVLAKTAAPLGRLGQAINPNPLVTTRAATETGLLKKKAQ